MNNCRYSWILLAITLFLCRPAFAQTPVIEWQKPLTETLSAFWGKTIATSDGNLLVAGESNRAATGADLRLSKLAQDGQVLWTKFTGGSGAEDIIDLFNTPDGGYLVAATTTSGDGDVVGFHTSATNPDAWIVKYSASGTLEWQKCIGGTGIETFISGVVQSDGTFIMVGRTNSSNGDFMGNDGSDKAYVVKLGSTGNVIWKTFTGAGSTAVKKMLIKPNGNVLIGGDNYALGNKGMIDVFLAEINTSGTVIMYRTYGGAASESCMDLVQTGTGKFTVLAITGSSNGDVVGAHGGSDVWAFTIDNSGNIIWQRTIGGSQTDDSPTMTFVAADSSMVLTSFSSSTDGDMTGNHGSYDLWVGKLSNAGNLEWKRCLGGSGFEQVYQAYVDAAGQTFLLAQTNSNDGDVSGYHGGNDLWFVKLTASGALDWQKCLGGSLNESAGKFIVDGNGFTLLAATPSKDGDVEGMHYKSDTGAVYITFNDDNWVVNIGGNGAVNWKKTLGGYKMEYPGNVVKIGTKYYVSSTTASNDGDVSGLQGTAEIWVVRLGDGTVPPPPVAQPIISGLANNYCSSQGVQKVKITNLPASGTTTTITLDNAALPVAADSSFSLAVASLAAGPHTIKVTYSNTTDTKTTTADFTKVAAVTPDVNVSANITQVINLTNPVVVTAVNATGGGKAPLYTFGWNRDLTNLIQAEGSSNTVSITPSTLTIGDNRIYVRMKTSEACYTTQANIDSITIRRDQATGLTDVDNPGRVIDIYPNPFREVITIQGLSPAKTYAITVYSLHGQVLSVQQVSNRNTATIAGLKQATGAYWISIYDQKHNRLLGTLPVVRQ
jgi:hypothetical protein